MDNLTHTLFGLTLTRTPLGRVGRGTTVALVLASNVPDIDFVAAAGGPMKYLEWHRGPTHGALGMAGLGLVAAGLVSLGLRKWDNTTAKRHASFLSLWIVAMVGATCHILMDVPTSYGTRLLSPFDWHWFAEDWLPIVDVYLLAILSAGLWIGRRAAAATPDLAAIRRARERSAAIALLFVAMNYGLRATAHHQALAQASELFGSRLPRPCANPPDRGLIDRWPVDHEAVSSVSGRCLVEIAAMPSFLSPFRWLVIARVSDAYQLHDLNLLAGGGADSPVRRNVFWSASRRYPDIWTAAVFQAATARAAQTFLGFSRFPAARSFVDHEGRATVRWTDMRFAMGDIGSQRARTRDLFTVTVHVNAKGTVEQEGLGP
jgi:inner membrane protein